MEKMILISLTEYNELIDSDKTKLIDNFIRAIKNELKEAILPLTPGTSIGVPKEIVEQNLSKLLNIDNLKIF